MAPTEKEWHLPHPEAERHLHLQLLTVTYSYLQLELPRKSCTYRGGMATTEAERYHYLIHIS